MTKKQIIANLANVADCKTAFATDCLNVAKIAREQLTEALVTNPSNDAIIPLYIGNCTLNKKAIALACSKLNIANVTFGKCTRKHSVNVNFDNIEINMNENSFTINASENASENDIENANNLCNLFYFINENAGANESEN